MTRIILALAMLLVFVAAISTEEIRIGYVDSGRIKNEFKEFKDAQDQFQKEYEAKILEAEKKRSDLQTKQEDFDKQKLILSPDKSKEKEAELQALLEEYQKYVAANFDQEQGELKKRSDELAAPVLDKVNKAVKKIAQENKYTVVFDVSSPSILYFKDNFDITEEVLRDLRK